MDAGVHGGEKVFLTRIEVHEDRYQTPFLRRIEKFGVDRMDLSSSADVFLHDGCDDGGDRGDSE